MLSRTLRECLIAITPGHLEATAQLWGVEGLPTQRREAANTLAVRMLEPGEIQRVWSILSEKEQEALAALQEADGLLPWSTFTRRWGEVRTMGPGRMARERPWESPASPAERLWYWGLVFRLPTQGPTGMYDAAFVPQEIRQQLPVTPEPPSLAVESIAAPPVTRWAKDHLLDDGCSLLATLQTRQVRPMSGGTWPEREEAILVRQLRDPDPDRLALLRHVASQLNWIRTDSAGCLRPDPETAVAWLQATPAEQRSALAHAWRESSGWNDLWHVPTLQPDDTGSWRNDPVLARQAILRHLTACRPSAWYALEAFIAAIKATDPDFQRPDGDYTSWYVRDAATGTYLDGFQAWDAVEGALIRYLIAGPMHWLGLVDLGMEGASGPPTAFSITAWGAAFLGLLRARPSAGEPLPLTVRPDLTVLVPAARRYDRFQLARVADWVRTGDPYVYRLTAGSLERAKQQRIRPERVIPFLEETTGGDVPHSARTVIERWAQRGAEVWVERRIVLRTREEAVLQQLTTAPATRRLIREVLGPRAALVAATDWPRLVRALVEAGFLPDLIDLGQEPSLDRTD
jgi:hypothetical protein